MNQNTEQNKVNVVEENTTGTDPEYGYYDDYGTYEVL